MLEWMPDTVIKCDTAFAHHLIRTKTSVRGSFRKKHKVIFAFKEMSSKV